MSFSHFWVGRKGLCWHLFPLFFVPVKREQVLRRHVFLAIAKAENASMTQKQANLEDFEVSQLRNFRQVSGKCQTSKRLRLCILTSKQPEKALLLLLLSSCFCAQSGLLKPLPPPPFIWPRGEPSRKSGGSSKLSLELAGENKLGVDGNKMRVSSIQLTSIVVS